MKHVAAVIRSISVVVLFVLSTTVLPFPAAFADPIRSLGARGRAD